MALSTLARNMRPQPIAAAVQQNRAAFSAMTKLPDLPYDYNALEPAISGQIMELHHSKHHQTYVNGFNAALEKYQNAESKGDIATTIALQGALKFNGGGELDLAVERQAPASAAVTQCESVIRSCQPQPFLELLDTSKGKLQALDSQQGIQVDHADSSCKSLHEDDKTF